MNFTKHLLLKALFSLSLMASLSIDGAQLAAETVATSDTDTLSPLPVPVSDAGSSSTLSETAEATQTVVLLGEKVSVENPDSAKGPFTDIAAIASATLGGNVIDLTTHGLTIRTTVDQYLPAALKAKPEVAILFTGYADEKAAAEEEKAGINEQDRTSSDEKQRDALATAVTQLQKAGARVFLVPSSTKVGALTSANLRLEATDKSATFVPMGTEVAGQPYVDAINGVQRELNAPPPSITASPEPSTFIKSVPKVETPAAASTPTVSVKQQQARLQEELSHIAGEAGEAAKAPPKATLTTFTDTLKTDSKTTNPAYPAGGSLTKRGAEAQENINMRPLPAVKAFRPQIPVPRNQVDKKEPGLSR